MARVIPGFAPPNEKTREDARLAQEARLRDLSDAALRAGGFIGRSKNSTQELAISTVGALGADSEKLDGTLAHIARLEAAEDADPIYVLQQQRRRDDLSANIDHTLEILSDHFGWRWKGRREDLTAACRTAWTTWGQSQ